ncbi:MAG TPA: dihydroorotase [Sphingobacteriaceae bacterium]
MSNLLLKSVIILNQASEFHNKRVDVRLTNGQITEIGKDLEVDGETEVFDLEGQFLAPGFIDLNANFGEPGLETKEDILSGSKAAAAGGFTGVALMPNTEPAVHSKAEVSLIMNRAKENLVNVYPLGAISKNREGKDLAELYDMFLSGAKAFTDGNRPVADAGLMNRALLYAKGFGGVIFSYPEDRSIGGSAKMNEGVTSTILGMKGMPALAEELMVSRDLFLAAYNDAPIHFSTITTSGSVALIREAKQRGMKVTCDVAAHHLVFTDDFVKGFDSNFKVKPPLRTEADVEALKNGLSDGTIDAVVSQHTPHEIEFKNVEFEIASYGIIALQTVLPLALKAGLAPDLIVEKLSVGPRKALRLPQVGFSVGEYADLVVFDPQAEWEFGVKTNYSRSGNSPLFNQKLKGKVSFVCNNRQYYLP